MKPEAQTGNMKTENKMPTSNAHKTNAKTTKKQPAKTGSAVQKKNSASRSRTTEKNASKQQDTRQKKKQEREIPEDSAVREPNPDSIFHQIMPYILGFAALFIAICMIAPEATGYVGKIVRMLLYGLFSSGAVAVPLLILRAAICWRWDVEHRSVVYKSVFALICLSFISVLLHIATSSEAPYGVFSYWNAGINWKGGGVLGGTLGWLLIQAVGYVGAIIVSVAMLAIFGMFLFGLTPKTIWLYIAYHRHEAKARRAEEEAARQKQIHRPVVTDPVYINRSEEEVARQGKEMASAAKDAAKKRDILMAANADLKQEKTADLPEEPENAVQESDEPVIDAAVFEEVLKNTRAELNPDDESAPSAAENVSCADTAPGVETAASGAESAKETIAPAGRLVKKRKPDAAFVSPEQDELQKKHDTGDFSDIFREEAVLSDDILRKFTDGSLGGKAELHEEETASDTELTVADGNAGASGLEVERTSLHASSAPSAEPEKPPYVFPALTMLNAGEPMVNTDISEELQTTAKRLVDTLRSFKVRTHIVNVSRGPTITRYELTPEEGVRVRSIFNLVDDIALNLATSGVRIEPIQGKQAVGIEVPNRTVATVYLRGMLENPKFQSAQSRITVALGSDVAGDPIYLDIAKMPHLLIAGATGMGKSVCINSMIVSLLYKATPDEVKLILVDPKKVELNIYNGLPHLLVPVVSDPKKAAGSLQWAVTEMERRFTLIEEVGVRDLKSYNAITKDDPEKEFLPQIVIIIDELADLMMTAPDGVEESICRLAQKARAAGMHLIIGTQRPSVDVITGLIKANIPSRIAFRVSQQVDSRTIIDMAGAEKLIGRGDMLYAPVGAPKPIRVQGAYVGEEEIEKVVDFIKRSHGEGVYDTGVIDSIEKEAARCCQGKKGSAASAEEEGEDLSSDPMLKPAIELAVDSGKISTSLIQRRLSLGYGRAAKLIDQMERMGVVSPPEGQKPRTVLITRQQYMEMVLHNDVLN